MRSRMMLLTLAAAAALAGCNDEPHAPYTPPTSWGRLRFVNASPDTFQAKTVDVAVNGQALSAGLLYRSVAGYATALPGDHEMRVLKGGTTTTLFSVTVPVVAGGDHTVLATGTATDIGPVTLVDDNAAPTAGNVKVRVVHASPAAGTVDVYVTAPGADLTTETPDISGMVFRNVSAYLTLPAGTHQIRFTATGTTAVALDISTGALSAGRIRTVLALDKAGGGTPLISAILSDR